MQLDWLTDLFINGSSVAHIVLLYAAVISVGVLLGKIKIGGVSLGVTFVLFVGIIVGGASLISSIWPGRYHDVRDC